MENINRQENLIENDENDLKILEELNSISAEPNQHFKNTLRASVISAYKEEPAEGKFFINDRLVNFLSIFIVILSVGIVAGAGVISFSNGNQVVSVDSVAAVPAAKKPEILEGIIKNNPDALILQTTKVVSDNPTDIANIAQTAQEVSVTSEVKGYNYSYTKAFNEFGKISCGENVTTKEIYTYSDNVISLYRTVNLDSNKQIIDSVQVETADGVSVSKYSRNGEGQVIFSSKNLETADAKPSSYPVSAPTVTQNNINNYFEESTQNLTEVTKDGKKYYVLDTQGGYNCNGSVINAAFKTWFNKEDFSLSKKEVFKTNSNESNLILRTTYTVANQELDYSSVKDNFLTEDLDNTFNISDLDSLQTLDEFLNSEVPFIPADKSLSNFKIANFQDITAMNSLFYKKDLDYLNNITNKPIAYITYKINSADVGIYSDEVPNESIFSSKAAGYEQQIQIGGEFYTGTLFRNTYPVSYAGIAKAKQVLIININGLKFVFSSNNLDSIINNGLESLIVPDVYYANKI